MILKVKSKTEELPLNHVQSPKRVTELNSTMTLNFKAINHPNSPGYRLLVNENIIELDGHEYRIKQLSNRPKYKNVKCVHVFSDLVGVRRDSLLEGTITLQQAANFLFDGTEWEVILDFDKTVDTKGFGNNNVVKLTGDLRNLFEVEFKILPGKQILIKEKISEDYGAIYRHAHNIQSLGEDFDSTSLRTKITGYYGPNGMSVTYISPLAEIYGESQADSVTDESIETETEMLAIIKAQLDDTIKFNLNVDAADTDAREVGETVRVIYEEMEINKSVRVLKIEEELRLVGDEYEFVPVTINLGNYILEGYVDKVIGQIESAKKDYRSKIEKLDTRITLQVEEIGENIASLEIKADSIVLTVTDLNTRMGSAESQIVQTANSLQFKVNETDYNGNRIASLINQTTTTIDIVAERINFVGQVFGDGATFKGNIETLQNARVGDNLFMSSTSVQASKGLYFGSTVENSVGRLTYTNGYGVQLGAEYLTLGSGMDVSIMASNLDLSNVYSVNWGNNKPTAVWG